MDNLNQPPDKKANLIPAFSEDKLKELFESEDYVFEIGNNHKIIAINRSSLKLFHKNENEIIGKGIDKIFPSEQAYIYKESLNKVINSGIPFSKISKLPTAHGDIFINTSLTPILDKNHKTKSILGIARDITQDYRNEVALDESEKIYKDIIDFAPVGYYQSSRKGEIILINNTLLKLLGYSN